MKKVIVVSAVLAFAACASGAAAAYAPARAWHFVPRVGYFDPVATGEKGTVAAGFEVLYALNDLHGVSLGVLYSKNDISAAGFDGKNLLLGVGVRQKLDTELPTGTFYYGIDLSYHRKKVPAWKYKKVGGTVLLGFEWRRPWRLEAGYTFAGNDEGVKMGGLAVTVGYKIQ
ncbi:MAG: hypothetical protein AB1742_15520 [bacterium]